MTFLWASIALFGLIVLGIFGFQFLSKKETHSQEVHSLEQILTKRKQNKRLGLPLFLFSLFVSTLFVSWSFDAKYTKLVEKKMYDQKVEEVDSIIQVVIKINTPPPPPKPVDPTPTIEQVVEVPEIKIVEKVEEKKDEPVIDTDFTPSVDFQFDPGPSTAPAQTTDNRIYFPGEMSQMPEYPGGEKAKTDYLTKTTYGVRKPLRAEKNNEVFRVRVAYVVEKDGTLSDIKIVRGGEELDEADRQKIIKSFQSMPKWSPGKVGDEPKRLRFSTDLKF